MSATGLAIELRGLQKTYARKKQTTVALDGLDLEVRRGEIFGLLGPNGAGKTTTVEICLGLQPPSAGEAFVLGRQWGRGEDREIQRRVGACFQETKFFEKQTVRETLELFAAVTPTGRTVDEALALVSLRDKQHARQAQLSGGQRQRLAVATALLGRPELLFLDEPTTGLDPQSRRQLWDVVREFQQQGGAVLLTTHYMDEAEQLCGRIAVVDHGRRIALGTPAELIAGLGAQHVIEAKGRELSRVGDQELLALPSVQRIERQGDQAALEVHSVHAALPPLLDLLRARGALLDGLSTRHASLEDVFVHLTGRSLRAEGEP
jgi:ABC-2 type transport system ATP-binding protein